MRISILIVLVLTVSSSLYSQTKKGFDISNSSIPVSEIMDGGPGKDGIPSIDSPKFVDANNSTLNDSDRVLGVFFNGIAKAYPINILNYHEIVNDYFNDHPVVITYCPLCGSGIAFNAKINERHFTFGVSGLLYNSDVLLYDRQTESLWSQLQFEAISGKLKKQQLISVNTENTTWYSWKQRHPQTQVLTEETGFIRDYSRNPYPNYAVSEQLYFPVNNRSEDFHAKEMVLGIRLKGKFKAYPFSELAKTNSGIISDTFNKSKISIVFETKNNSARLIDLDNEEIESITTYWFAWYAFHPETEIYRAN